MTRFGRYPERSGRELAEEVVGAVLRDAGLEPVDVQAVFSANATAGLMNGQESIRGQVGLRNTGMLGVPLVNVENACASSSTALHLAWQAVTGGLHDCVLVVGWDKGYDPDRAKSVRALNATMDLGELAEVFGGDRSSGRSAFMDLFGLMSDGRGRNRFSPDLLAQVSVKNHHHGSLNPCSQYRDEVTAESVLSSRAVVGALTVLMCAPLSDGAAALVLCAPGFRAGGEPGVRIAASILTSGRGDDLRRPSAVQRAIGEAWEAAGTGFEDVDVVELHDATAVAELALYEELGMCPPGEAERLIRDQVTWLGGRLPVNTSGGMLSRGHPMGATGAAQVVELVWQLQGRCGARQVPSARVAMAQNQGGWVGTDSAVCCVHVLQRERRPRRARR